MLLDYTLSGIRDYWQQIKNENLAAGASLWRCLLRNGDDNLGWLLACQAALCDKNDKPIQSWLKDDGLQILRNDCLTLGLKNYPKYASDLVNIITGYLLCVQTLRKDAYHEQSTFSSDELKKIAKKSNLPPGFIADVACELRGQSLRAVVNPEQDKRHHYVLLVDSSENAEDSGVIAELILERLDNGTGEYYPTPHQALCLARDDRFYEAEKNAQDWIKKHRSWPSTIDIRWELKLLSDSSGLSVAGSSMGAILALGLANLLSDEDEWKELDLTGVSATAEIDYDGNIKTVGGVWDKLESKILRDVVNTVIVAEKQEGIPGDYLKPNVDPLRVLKFGNLKNAMQILDVESKPYREVCKEIKEQCKSFFVGGEKAIFEEKYLPINLVQYKSDKKQTALSFDDVWTFHTSAESIDNCPKIAILGASGCGKTTLLRNHARKVVNRDFTYKNKPLLPVYIDIDHWQKQHGELDEYLAYVYRLLHKGVTLEHWQRWLRKGRLLLLIDRLERVLDYNDLASKLELGKSCPIVFTCREESWGDIAGIGLAQSVYFLPTIDNDFQLKFIENYPFNNDVSRRNLADQFREISSLKELAKTPYMLTLICSVADRKSGLNALLTRSELYEEAVIEFLKGCENKNTNSGFPKAPEQCDILKMLSIQLVISYPHQLSFSSRKLRKTLIKVLKLSSRDTDLAALANTLYESWHKVNILQYNENEDEYSFIHDSLQTYLTAGALIQHAEEGEWVDFCPWTDGESKTILQWLLEESIVSYWRDVLSWLVEIIPSEDKNDLLLPVINQLNVSKFSEQEQAKRVLQIFGGNAITATVVDELSKLLDSTADKQRLVLEIFDTFASSSKNHLQLTEAFSKSIDLIVDENQDAALSVLISIGTTIVSDNIRVFLFKSLVDDATIVRQKAVQAVEALIPDLATREFVVRLNRLSEEHPTNWDLKDAIRLCERTI